MPRKKMTHNEDYYSAFPTRLRAIMEEKNLTQQDIATAIGKTRQAVGYYADGSSSPDWKTIVKLSEFLSVSTDFLLGRSNVRSVEGNEYTAASLGIPESFIDYFSLFKDIDPSEAPVKKVVGSFLSHPSFIDSVNSIAMLTDFYFYPPNRAATEKNWSSSDIDKLKDELFDLTGGEYIIARSVLSANILIDAAENRLREVVHSSVCDLMGNSDRAKELFESII